jgi:hypothetical protein
MTEAHIFPTLGRIKPSKLLAYPIGVEALSRGLDGVPQHDLLACDFSAGNPHHEQQYRERLYIMAFSYEKIPRSFHHSQASGERGVFDPRWHMHVYAVPAELRADIKQLLIADTLPQVVRPWLVEHSPITGKTGGAALILHYDRTQKKIISEARSGFFPETSR